MTTYSISIKRAYDKRIPSADFCILVDRLWPRGLSKRQSNIDLWLREIAPSDSLRKWFNHEPDKWKEFQKKYYRELNSKNQENVVDLLDKIKEKKSITLVYAAKDEKYNNAVALRGYLLRKLDT